jgi:hypothetical protein
MLMETEVLSKAWAGEMPVKDACNELADKIDALLATEKK